MRKQSDGERGHQPALADYIKSLEAEHGCRIGVSLRDPVWPDGGFSYRGSELFHAASTMKVPVMIEVFRQAEEGRFRLQDPLMLQTTFQSMIDDSSYTVEPGKNLRGRVGEQIPILELTEEMIVVSDNVATNLLLTLVGAPKVTGTMRRLGVQEGYVLRCLMDTPAFDAGLSNRLTPDGLSLLMEAIEQGRAGSEEATAEMRRILLNQRFREMIPAGVPNDVAVGNKTGNITAVAHDTAIVYAPNGTYYLTIMIDGLETGKRGSEIAPLISRYIFEERSRLAPAPTK
jgi:beta-lactamase class A